MFRSFVSLYYCFTLFKKSGGFGDDDYKECLVENLLLLGQAAHEVDVEELREFFKWLLNGKTHR